MEDEVVIYGNFRQKFDEDYVAVFDGHGGTQASHFAAETHYKILEELLNETQDDVIYALQQSFKKTQAQMEQNFPSNFGEGSTALVCLFLKRKLYVSNLGDSRAVMCRGGQAVRLSRDHKPTSIEEERRIRELGGHIQEGRVNGKLAVSRAFGDFYMKPFVTCEPYINTFDLTDDDMYVILACDGLWDMLSDQQAVDLIQEERHPAHAAALLRDYAYLLGSTDNISVIVIKIQQ